MFTLRCSISFLMWFLTSLNGTWATKCPSLHFLCSVCHISSALWAEETNRAYHDAHLICFLCETLLLNPSVEKKKKQGTNFCSPCVATKRLLHGSERAQYAPVSDKGNRATVCSQSWYEWEPSSPSCAHTGPPCTSLEWKRLFWHWSGPENNPLNGLHTMTVIVGEKEWTLLEHGQTWKNAASVTVALADITVMSLHFRGGPGFQPPPSPCASHCWLTGSQPHDWAYPLHVVLPAFTGAMFFLSVCTLAASRMTCAVSLLEAGCGYGSTHCWRLFAWWENIAVFQ